MSFVRVALSSSKLPGYVPGLPLDLTPHPAQAAVDATLGTGHVTPTFAFAVAADLLGLEFALHAVREQPLLLATWVTLIETHGWGNNLREMDLQISLLANAIKVLVRPQAPTDDLRLEGLIYNKIVEVAQGDQSAQDQLVEYLISGKGMTMPWALVIPVLPQ